jgi:electron transport complex protein RnfG
MAVQSSFKNMTICLLAICLVCSGLLAGVYALTKEPIDAASKAKNEAAIKEVLPEEVAKIEEERSIEVDGVTYTYNLAYDESGSTVGCAVNVAPVGFGGPIVIKVGFKVDPKTNHNIVWNTKVLSHAETPGLGAKCSEPAFADQFKGLDPVAKKLSVTKDGGDIDAITASTITSRAFTNGVATAVNVLSAIAGTPMLIDNATGASSTEWTAPTDSTNVILNEGEGSQK